MLHDYGRAFWSGSIDPNEIGIARPIAERFAKIASEHPTKIAIDDGAVRFSYAETLARVEQLALRIVETVPAGRPVATVLPNTAHSAVAALACFAAGRPYVPIDLDHPVARNAEILHEVGVSAAIALPKDPAVGAVLPAGLPEIDVTAFAVAAEPWALPPVDAAAPAVILYTSGSTGQPKGICNAQHALVRCALSLSDAGQVSADDRVLLLSSPSGIAGVRDSMVALLNGATLRIADLRRVGIGGVRQILRDEKITVYISVPAVMRSVLSQPGSRTAAGGLRLVRLGGDTVFNTDIELASAVLPEACDILVGFGLTEATRICQWVVRPGVTEGGRIPSGYPVPGIQFALLDDDGTAVPAGEVGELVVRGRYIALGLWQDGRLAPGPFAADPDDPTVRIFHTGDLMRLRDDGLFAAYGRKDRQIKISGRRIDPGEIEAALRTCPGVADAAVIARRASETDIRLVAFAATTPGAGLQSSEISAALAMRLPPAKVPGVIHVVDEIPRLPGFKPDMATLIALDRARRDARRPACAGLSAKSGVETAIGTAWGSILGDEALAPERPWEAGGGDSLKALQLLLQLEETLARRLPTDVLSPGMTPSSLAAAIARHIAAHPDADEPDSAMDRRPTVFATPGIYGDRFEFVRLSYSLREQIRFEVIDYPDWREMLAAQGDFTAIVDSAVRQISQRAHHEELRLVGYSFGGFVAFAAAQRLVEAGRSVAFLGLLDPRLQSRSARGQQEPSIIGIIAAVVGAFKTRQFPLTRWFLGLFPPVGAYRTLGAIARFLMALPGSRHEIFVRDQLLRVLRRDALRHWVRASRPRWMTKPSDVATVLFRSAEELPDEPQDYGWGALCSRFHMVMVGGDHLSLLNDPIASDRLSSAFLAALAENSHEAPRRDDGAGPQPAGNDDAEPGRLGSDLRSP